MEPHNLPPRKRTGIWRKVAPFFLRKLPRKDWFMGNGKKDMVFQMVWKKNLGTFSVMRPKKTRKNVKLLSISNN